MVVVVMFLMIGIKLFFVGKKEVSSIMVISVSVKGLRIWKSFIKIFESWCSYFVFFVLRNKIDLLYLYMNLVDELFIVLIVYFYYCCSG